MSPGDLIIWLLLQVWSLDFLHLGSCLEICIFSQMSVIAPMCLRPESIMGEALTPIHSGLLRVSLISLQISATVTCLLQAQFARQ